MRLFSPSRRDAYTRPSRTCSPIRRLTTSPLRFSRSPGLPTESEEEDESDDDGSSDFESEDDGDEVELFEPKAEDDPARERALKRALEEESDVEDDEGEGDPWESYERELERRKRAERAAGGGAQAKGKGKGKAKARELDSSDDDDDVVVGRGSVSTSRRVKGKGKARAASPDAFKLEDDADDGRPEPLFFADVASDDDDGEIEFVRRPGPSPPFSSAPSQRESMVDGRRFLDRRGQVGQTQAPPPKPKPKAAMPSSQAGPSSASSSAHRSVSPVKSVPTWRNGTSTARAPVLPAPVPACVPSSPTARIHARVG